MTELSIQRPIVRLLIALATGENAIDHSCASFWRDDPRAIGPWGIVTNMLIVTAFELRHPMVFLILMEANDLSVHNEQGT